MKQNLPIVNKDYLVLVRCYTYNHSKYIENALKGFVVQKTNFPYVCLIVDDASTDGAQDVIKSFLNSECEMGNAKFYDVDTAYIIEAQHRTNILCTMVVYLLKENLYKQPTKKTALITPWRNHCKYEAMCEGDDYWINPLKLQMQVDYMEQNPDCSLVYTNINVYNEKLKKMKEDRFKNIVVPKNFQELVVRAGFFAPCTWLTRITTINEVVKEKSKDGTYTFMLELFANNYKIKFINEICAVYRVVSESASHSDNKRKSYLYGKSVYETKYKYLNKYAQLVEEGCEDQIDLIFAKKYGPSIIYYDKEITNKIRNCSLFPQLPLMSKLLFYMPRFLSRPIIYLKYRMKGKTL